MLMLERGSGRTRLTSWTLQRFPCSILQARGEGRQRATCNVGSQCSQCSHSEFQGQSYTCQIEIYHFSLPNSPQRQDSDAACGFARFSTSGIPCFFPAKLLGSEWVFPQPGPARRTCVAQHSPLLYSRQVERPGNIAWYRG
jgi:hypothetical protein